MGGMWVANFWIGLCAVLIVLNWIGLLGSISNRTSFSFAPPFLAGIFGSIAAFGHPSPAVNAFAWVPVVVDPSIGFALCWTALVRIRKFRKG